MVDKKQKGNARYKGFLPDMLAKLKDRLHFDYELYEVEVGSILVGFEILVIYRAILVSSRAIPVSCRGSLVSF